MSDDPRYNRSSEHLWPYPLWESRHPEEPAYGLLARTVERNLPGTLWARFQDLGAYGGCSVNKASVPEIARLCNADRSALDHATPKVEPDHAVVLGSRFRRDDFSVATRRWCPNCLSEHGCHLAWWDLTIVTTCPRHRVGLIKQCACGSAIGWKRQFAFSGCNCGRRLADAPAENLAENEGASDRYLVGRLTGVETLAVTLLDQLPLLDVVEILRNVGHLSIRPLAKRRQLENEVGFRRLFDAGYEGLANFPSSFRALLDRKRDEAVVPEGKFGAGRVYGKTFQKWIHQSEPASVAGALSAEIRAHAALNLTVHKRMILGEAADVQMISMVKAAAICGVPLSRMRKILIQRGLLRNGVGHPSLTFKRDFIDEIAKTLQWGITKQQVARELDVPQQYLPSLIAAGVIAVPISGGNAAAGKMPPDAATALIERLDRAVKPHADRQNCLPIPLACKSLRMNIAVLISELLAGNLEAVGVMPGARGLNSILVDVVASRAARLARKTTVTAIDIARTYGVRELVVRNLSQMGAIPARRGDRAWAIDKLAAEEFFRIHATLGPYAKRLKTREYHLACCLEASGFRPTYAPPLVKEKLFRRSDIEIFLNQEGWPPKLATPRAETAKQALPPNSQQG